MTLPFQIETESTDGFLLRVLEVYNWGPFQGYHRAHIDPKGSAIVGPTGSGKTTLIDALMTLLVQNPRYNLASTGGHESDRDLMSYVRGVMGTGDAVGSTHHISRREKTTTGLCATFSDGEKCIRLAAILWVDGTSMAIADLRRLWIFSEREDDSLEAWLTAHHEDGARPLRKEGRDAIGVSMEESKTRYLARVRRYFEVGENAFSLLNRAAGLKQLNSIDEIFRDLVLDDVSGYDRAAEVVSDFDTLKEIRAELELAREQQKSLIPVERTHRKYLSQEESLQARQRLKKWIAPWFALKGVEGWGASIAKIDASLSTLGDETRALGDLIDGQEKRCRGLHEEYLKLGGNALEGIRETQELQEKLTAGVRGRAEDYLKIVGALGLDATLSESSHESNQLEAMERVDAASGETKRLEDAAFSVGAEYAQASEESRQLKEKRQAVLARPGSNIPPQFQDFRTHLAGHLGIDDGDLPFLAELVEVRSEEKHWRGAIERALGGHRLRILIEPRLIKSALRWVNDRHNHLHVRLLEARDRGSPSFFADGFTRKLNFKSHPLRESLKSFLASIDRHCVDSPETLQTTEHAMTQAGFLSGKKGLFEKQDKTRIEEGWMTGFDNRDQLAAIDREFEQVALRTEALSERVGLARQEAENARASLGLLNRIIDTEFAAIDLPGAEAKLEAIKRRIRELSDPNSDAGAALQRYEVENDKLSKLREMKETLGVRRGSLEKERGMAEKRLQNAQSRLKDDLDEADIAFVDDSISLPDDWEPEQLEELERHAVENVDREISAISTQLGDTREELVRRMEGAKKIDSGPLSEAGTEMSDIAAYIERLQTLTKEALPEKLKRFLAYLNVSSDQGVTQLISKIENEISTIEERIGELNQTLRVVDFQHGRYLRLETTPVRHKVIEDLDRARKRLRVAALRDDEGESHFRALQEMISILRDATDSRRTVAARALLDPRYRLSFGVTVRNRSDDTVVDNRKGSQGGSGGEKEVFASYILTASLSYALCPPGASRPRYATIILDEAFSKSSHAAASRIVEALREFGLHPLFVTPNKEMRLLRRHTRSLIIVFRGNAPEATVSSMSWEELDTKAAERSEATA
jgi:uncharacterized protein YPO0396